MSDRDEKVGLICMWCYTSEREMPCDASPHGHHTIIDGDALATETDANDAEIARLRAPVDPTERLEQRAFNVLCEIVADPDGLYTPDAPRTQIQDVLDWLHGKGFDGATDPPERVSEQGDATYPCPSCAGPVRIVKRVAGVTFVERVSEASALRGALVALEKEAGGHLAHAIGHSDHWIPWAEGVKHAVAEIRRALEDTKGDG